MRPVYIYRHESKCIEKISFKTIPLGSIKDFSYRQEKINFKAGDTILFLSDGLPELFDEKGDIFGYNRVEETFASVAGWEPQEIIDHLVKAGKEWNRGGPPGDDITLIVLKVT